jgi:acyl dehydratase
VTQNAVITDAMRRVIGVESQPYTFEVEKGDIVRYAQAIGEVNPLFMTEPAARKMRYGGIIAPPTYLIVMRFIESQVANQRALLQIPYRRSLDGGSDWTYLEPIRPGDRLTATAKIAELYERDGSRGHMFFVVTEITYVNQFGEVVVRQRDTAIYY